jgi:peptidoglycan/LPS O-acetylase OafA/YrhL
MKKGRKNASPVTASPVTGSQRLLFFDILRIFFVAAIVYDHFRFSYFAGVNGLFFTDGFLPFNIYTAGLQGWAVFGLIFVSGAVLEYNYKRIEGYWEYLKFLFKRCIRIYPAFWLSLLFGLFLNIALTSSAAGEIIRNNLFYIIFEYTGFFVILGQGPGFINTMGWFIGTIILLYLLFPWLSQFVRKYQLIAIIAIMIVTYSSRWLFFTYNALLPDLLWRWFPLCNLFEFCLGIYVIQMNFYPKNVKSYPIIHEIAELSFYVFLFHVIVIQVFTVGLGYGQVITGFFDMLFSQFPVLIQNIFRYMIIEITVLLVSIAAMKIDRKIQECIRQNQRVRDFLTSRSPAR